MTGDVETLEVPKEAPPKLLINGVSKSFRGTKVSVEALACARALATGWLPPTINYEHRDPDCDLDYVPNNARPWQPSAAMSNSFGLGGHNATVIFRALDNADVR